MTNAPRTADAFLPAKIKAVVLVMKFLYNRHGSTINFMSKTRNSGSRIIFPDLFATAMSFPELDVDIQLPIDSSLLELTWRHFPETQ